MIYLGSAWSAPTCWSNVDCETPVICVQVPLLAYVKSAKSAAVLLPQRVKSFTPLSVEPPDACPFS